MAGILNDLFQSGIKDDFLIIVVLISGVKHKTSLPLVLRHLGKEFSVFATTGIIIFPILFRGVCKPNIFDEL